VDVSCRPPSYRRASELHIDEWGKDWLGRHSPYYANATALQSTGWLLSPDMWCRPADASSKQDDALHVCRTYIGDRDDEQVH
jgi:hypothetical protein